MIRFAKAVPILTLIATLLVSVSSPAQESGLDELHLRLEEARARLDDIQSSAGSVEEQIASIDEQAAAVEDALSATDALVDRTQAEIGVLEREIEAKQSTYDRVRRQARKIAVSLYKAGPTAELDALLGAKSIPELVSMVEYASSSTKQKSTTMILSARLKAQLAEDRGELEVKLGEALNLRREQLAQSQHLKELRAAQTMRLADLRERIRSGQAEAEALASRSSEIEAQLASAAPAPAPAAPAPAPVALAAPSGASSSGFAWPINGAITSGYGERWGRMHTGIDIDCVTGNPIRASKAGTVVTSAYDSSGYGNYIVIDHGGGYATLYAHMSAAYASGSVAQGETIGACGATGASTGDHLHFEVRVNGSPQDPLAYLP
jgi:murein DD-endopeptidase MepM/ murein hydrolase activator NlpD